MFSWTNKKISVIFFLFVFLLKNVSYLELRFLNDYGNYGSKLHFGVEQKLADIWKSVSS